MARLHPGKTLIDQYLKPNGLSQNQLARAIGVPPRRINEIILGKRSITADTAIRLGYFFGNSASYWMHLQSEYEIGQAQEKNQTRLSTIQPIYMDEDKLKSGMSDIESSHNDEPKTQSKNIKRRIMR
jgi:addiction module HigA family antidote